MCDGYGCNCPGAVGAAFGGEGGRKGRGKVGKALFLLPTATPLHQQLPTSLLPASHQLPSSFSQVLAPSLLPPGCRLAV